MNCPQLVRREVGPQAPPIEGAQERTANDMIDILQHRRENHLPRTILGWIFGKLGVTLWVPQMSQTSMPWLVRI